MPRGDVLVIAGDLCHASCLEADPVDGYNIKQRDRAPVIDAPLKNFAHVLFVAGNHEHYGSVFDETVPKLRRALPGVTILDNESIEIGSIQFFGTTLWPDYQGRSAKSMDALRKSCGEFFFVKMRVRRIKLGLYPFTTLKSARAELHRRLSDPNGRALPTTAPLASKVVKRS